MAVVINDFEVIPGDQPPKPAEGGQKSKSPKPIVLSPTPAAMNDAHGHMAFMAARGGRVRVY